jgi:hypothetical protein
MAESSEFVKLLVGDYGPIVGPHPLDDFLRRRPERDSAHLQRAQVTAYLRVTPPSSSERIIDGAAGHQTHDRVRQEERARPRQRVRNRRHRARDGNREMCHCKVQPFPDGAADTRDDHKGSQPAPSECVGEISIGPFPGCFMLIATRG